MRLRVRTAHVENRQFLAAHRRDFESHQGRRMDAGQDHAAAVARGVDRPIRGVLPGGAVDRAVHAAAAGVGGDLARRVHRAGIEHGISAHVLRHLAPVRHWFDGEDPSGSGNLQAGNRQQADRTCAEDRHRLSRLDRGELQGVQRHCERLRNGRQFHGQGRRYRQQVHGRKVDELAEESRQPRIAQKTDIRANVVAAGAAEFAVVAIDRRLQRRAVPGRPTGHAADLFSGRCPAGSCPSTMGYWHGVSPIAPSE